MRSDSARRAWEIWQANKLDAAQTLIISDALVDATSCALVWPAEGFPGGVRITGESATECVVRRDPETGLPVDGLKAWQTADGRRYATLYTVPLVYKWWTDDKGEWARRDVPGELWPLPNPVAPALPLVELAPRPQTVGDPLSELDGLLDTQDRLNTTIFARVMGAWYSAQRQRYATGLNVEYDSETGEQRDPFETMVDSMLYSTDPGTKFGEFSAIDLGPLISAQDADLRLLAGQSKTPVQLLLQGGNGLNGDSYKAHLSELIVKVNRRAEWVAEFFEQVLRVALIAAGDPGGLDESTEVRLADPEYRTEGELVDALVKMATLEVPRRVLWARWGASPQELDQWESLRQREDLTRPQPIVIAGPTGTPPADPSIG